MNLRLNPLYKKLLMLAIVIGPIFWLVFTDDGQRRTDLVMLHVFGDGGELNLAIEKLNSGMTEYQFRELFPDLALGCDESHPTPSATGYARPRWMPSAGYPRAPLPCS